MNINRILFHDASLQRFDWCRYNSETETLETGHAEIEQLSRTFAAGTAVSVYIPQQMLFITSVQMPPRASKQQLNAIAYAIEDQLAEDIEDCFFAIMPQQADDSVPVAVINQQKMNDLSMLLAEHHIQVRMILPQVYLCPWRNEGTDIAAICKSRNGYLVRTAQHEGLYCESPALNSVISLISKHSDQKQQTVVVYGLDSEALSISNVEVVPQPDIELLSQQVNESQCLNLKQKQYQSSHQWLSVLQRWKWPAAALALLLLVLISDTVISVWQQTNKLNNLLQQQRELLQKYQPELAESDNPRLALTRFLADNQQGAQQTGFLDQLYEFVRLKQGISELKLGKIQFQKSSLIVDLESKDLKSLETLRSKLPQSSFKARIDNVNINPEKTTGRLIMESDA